MSASNRAAKIVKLHRVAKKRFETVRPPTDRSVLEHLLYACCLENSGFEQADEAFARLQQDYFDWNEIRVTTAVELAEVMSCLSEPHAAATRLKTTLHAVFETHYTFEIEFLKKENLGKAVQQLQKYKGISPFAVSYVAQNALGGHSIGVDRALLQLLSTIGAISNGEADKQTVPGLERAVPKSKGVDFFSVVHQLAVAYLNSPFSPEVRKTLLEIDPEAKQRFPKRGGRKKVVVKSKASPKKKAAKPTAKSSARSTKSAVKPRKKKAPASSVKKKKVAAKAGSSRKKSPTRRLAKKKPR